MTLEVEALFKLKKKNYEFLTQNNLHVFVNFTYLVKISTLNGYEKIYDWIFNIFQISL